jgi:hypothetical protein
MDPSFVFVIKHGFQRRYIRSIFKCAQGAQSPKKQSGGSCGNRRYKVSRGARTQKKIPG